MINNGWAFKKNEHELGKENREEYKKLTERYKIYKAYRPCENEEEYDLIYTREACYHHGKYTVIKKPIDITTEELLLIFDDGNLCFGGGHLGGNTYRVNED